MDFNENNSRFLYLVHVKDTLYNKRKRLNYEIKE